MDGGSANFRSKGCRPFSFYRWIFVQEGSCTGRGAFSSILFLSHLTHFHFPFKCDICHSFSLLVSIAIYWVLDLEWISRVVISCLIVVTILNSHFLWWLKWEVFVKPSFVIDAFLCLKEDCSCFCSCYSMSGRMQDGTVCLLLHNVPCYYDGIVHNFFCTLITFWVDVMLLAVLSNAIGVPRQEKGKNNLKGRKNRIWVLLSPLT